MTLVKASEFYDIPRSRLADAVSGKTRIHSTFGPRRWLSDEQENSLTCWLTTIFRTRRKITMNEVLHTGKGILDKSGLHLPRLKNNLPRSSWWHGFLSRHPEVERLRNETFKPKKLKEETGN